MLNIYNTPKDTVRIKFRVQISQRNIIFAERSSTGLIHRLSEDRAGAVFTQDYREGFDREGNKHLSTTEENNLRLRLTRVS